MLRLLLALPLAATTAAVAGAEVGDGCDQALAAAGCVPPRSAKLSAFYPGYGFIRKKALPPYAYGAEFISAYLLS